MDRKSFKGHICLKEGSFQLQMGQLKFNWKFEHLTGHIRSQSCKYIKKVC